MVNVKKISNTHNNEFYRCLNCHYVNQLMIKIIILYSMIKRIIYVKIIMKHLQNIVMIIKRICAYHVQKNINLIILYIMKI